MTPGKFVELISNGAFVGGRLRAPLMRAPEPPATADIASDLVLAEAR